MGAAMMDQNAIQRETSSLNALDQFENCCREENTQLQKEVEYRVIPVLTCQMLSLTCFKFSDVHTFLLVDFSEDN